MAEAAAPVAEAPPRQEAVAVRRAVAVDKEERERRAYAAVLESVVEDDDVRGVFPFKELPDAAYAVGIYGYREGGEFLFYLQRLVAVIGGGAGCFYIPEAFCPAFVAARQHGRPASVAEEGNEEFGVRRFACSAGSDVSYGYYRGREGGGGEKMPVIAGIPQRNRCAVKPREGGEEGFQEGAGSHFS
jgi:hypothetical protein